MHEGRGCSLFVACARWPLLDRAHPHDGCGCFRARRLDGWREAVILQPVEQRVLAGDGDRAAGPAGHRRIVGVASGRAAVGRQARCLDDHWVIWALHLGLAQRRASAAGSAAKALLSIGE